MIGVIFAALAGSCLLCLVVGALTDEEARTQRAPTPAGSLDGQYVCVVPGRSAPGGVTTADVTLDMTLNISGHTYEGSGGDGGLTNILNLEPKEQKSDGSGGDGGILNLLNNPGGREWTDASIRTSNTNPGDNLVPAGQSANSGSMRQRSDMKPSICWIPRSV